MSRNITWISSSTREHPKFMVAEDIADMLSTDMQKEGLCGRTLTLKLKTASFEVCLLLYHQSAKCK